MNYITFTFLGELFGVSTTTVHRCIKMFTDAMTKKKEDIIYLPDDAEAAAIADRFEQKSYTGRNLSPECESYNVYLSRVGMAIEMAFGRLKARWRR